MPETLSHLAWRIPSFQLLLSSSHKVDNNIAYLPKVQGGPWSLGKYGYIASVYSNFCTSPNPDRGKGGTSSRRAPIRRKLTSQVPSTVFANKRHMIMRLHWYINDWTLPLLHTSTPLHRAKQCNGVTFSSRCLDQGRVRHCVGVRPKRSALRQERKLLTQPFPALAEFQPAVMAKRLKIKRH